MEFIRPQRERLGDFVYGQLLEKIASGEFTDGAKLPSEKELGELFAVSRPVVREAILRLQSDEIVVSRQGSGTYVQRRPPPRLMEVAGGSAVADILRCHEVRISLEGEAARLAGARRTEADLVRLRDALGKLREQFESGELRPDVDIEFHRTVVSCTGNRFFMDVFEFLALRIKAGVVATLHVTRSSGMQLRVNRVYEEHERICDAIADNDSEGAEIAMRYHLTQARKRLLDRKREY